MTRARKLVDRTGLDMPPAPTDRFTVVLRDILEHWDEWELYDSTQDGNSPPWLGMRADERWWEVAPGAWVTSCDSDGDELTGIAERLR